jgi:hypothetical protein
VATRCSQSSDAVRVAHSELPPHVRQRSMNDCVIATVAMVANLPYDAVAERAPVAIGSRGLWPHEVRRLLLEATGVPWNYPRYAWLRRIARIAIGEDLAVAVIRRPWRWGTLHCIGVQGGLIRDPELARGYRADEYPRCHWRTLVVLRPESAIRLMFVQHFRS